MEKQLSQLFTTQQISTHRNQGILIAPVMDLASGFRLAKEVLYELVDKRTALFLSGGKTPKEIYRKITEEKKLRPGVVGQVDERYGTPMHEESNELLFDTVGFLDYLKTEHVQFHPILSQKAEREELADRYDQLLRQLFTIFQKSVATLGIGVDGHIAGIAPSAKQNFENPLFEKERQYLFVSEFNDAEGSFGERITMTFLGLSMMDFLIVLVFGEEKKEVLEKMFDEGKEQDIPARFLKRPEIAGKVLIITDQQL